MRLKNYHDELVEISERLSYEGMADYFMEKYEIMLHANTIKDYFKRNNIHKTPIMRGNSPYQHGQRREKSSKSCVYSASMRVGFGKKCAYIKK